MSTKIPTKTSSKLPTNLHAIASANYPPKSPHPILNLGFRVFFVGASVFAIITMGLWLAVLQGWIDFTLTAFTPFMWHAHEMIFGYALAVIAGFLLTAVKTWTNQPMPYGWRLFAIFLPWALARLTWACLPQLSSDITAIGLRLASGLDILWWSLVCVAVFTPIIRVRQRRQIGILAKLALLWLAFVIFAIGAWRSDIAWQKTGVYLAFYLIIGVVLTIGRRVMPMFISNGINHHLPKNAPKVELKNAVWVDRVSLFGFLAFMLADLCGQPVIASLFALVTALANGYRLMGWYHSGMWGKPLVWSLFIAFGGMVVALGLFAVLPWAGFAHSLAVHTLALSGIGVMTLSMMSRVSLGHTGLSVHEPPKLVGVILTLMVVTIVTRGLLPIVLPAYYTQLLTVSQVLWLISFILFLCVYLPILSKPRKDGLFG